METRGVGATRRYQSRSAKILYQSALARGASRNPQVEQRDGYAGRYL